MNKIIEAELPADMLISENELLTAVAKKHPLMNFIETAHMTQDKLDLMMVVMKKIKTGQDVKQFAVGKDTAIAFMPAEQKAMYTQALEVAKKFYTPKAHDIERFIASVDRGFHEADELKMFLRFLNRGADHIAKQGNPNVLITQQTHAFN
jgi:hypothetical protein